MLNFQSLNWSEREDLNLRPLVSQTSALTGLRYAPCRFGHVSIIAFSSEVIRVLIKKMHQERLRFAIAECIVQQLPAGDKFSQHIL